MSSLVCRNHPDRRADWVDKAGELLCNECHDGGPTQHVLAEVAAERTRQNTKWGEQNHPLVDLDGPDINPARIARQYWIPTAKAARGIVARAAEMGRLSWVDIALEELCEAVEELDRPPARGEWLQLAAVCVAAVECIDRKAARDVR